jgi:TPR repeat protein
MTAEERSCGTKELPPPCFQAWIASQGGRTVPTLSVTRLLLVLAFACASLVSAQAQYTSDEINSLQDACEGGDANSCNDLGLIYSYGQDVELDLALAAKYFAQACDGGETTGCSNLGNMYRRGEGVTQDFNQAAVYFQKACDGGDADDCAMLGWAYLDGDGLDQDYARAVGNFRKACDGGDADGCLGLATVHDEGLGVPEDLGRAVEFYGVACDRGSEDGCGTLGDWYAEGEVVEQNIALAFDYYGRGCIVGNAELCNLAAESFENGTDLEPDMFLAVRYYRRSCSLSDEDGCANLARLFPGESCPCFDAAEIMKVCPRPDAAATQHLVETESDGRRSLQCFSTRNYSPGSIMFELYPAGPGGTKGSCFVQSVDVEPYGSRGSGFDLTPEWLAGCVQVQDDVAAQLGIQLTRE